MVLRDTRTSVFEEQLRLHQVLCVQQRVCAGRKELPFVCGDDASAQPERKRRVYIVVALHQAH
uniref:Uncharacterized protein n=1 Tax=Oryza nivara TaxID=4536 RepID=A0A0E0JBP2_ORYNI